MLKFDKFYHDTGRAILVQYQNKKHWIPKKLCRNITVNKKLGGHVSIPSFFYENMGYEVSEDISDKTIIHHVPEKKKPIKSEINELTR
jgi:hypothetical protein